MSKLWFNILLISAVLYLSDAVDNYNGKKELCYEKCEELYSLQNEKEYAACQQGCQLYITSKILIGDKPQEINEKQESQISPVKEMCYTNCKEEFGEGSVNWRIVACDMGCDELERILSQTQELGDVVPPSIKSENETSIDEEKDESPSMFVRPIMQVKEVMSKVVGMFKFVQSSMTTYFRTPDNRLIALRGPVSVTVQLLDPKNKEQTENKEEQPEDDKNFFGYGDQQASDSLLAGDGGPSSIERMSRKVGVPPYLLVASLVCFVAFLGYVIFVICSSPSRARKEKKLKCISATSMPTHNLPVKLIRPEDLTKLTLVEDDLEDCCRTKLKVNSMV